jgi:hypothetical protein
MAIAVKHSVPMNGMVSLVGICSTLSSYRHAMESILLLSQTTHAITLRIGRNWMIIVMVRAVREQSLTFRKT